MPDLGPDRDVAKLQPHFRARLDAALREMDDLGYPCRVIEAFRSQDRQNHLYSIGRRGIPKERPVTWTRASKHTRGTAADVVHATLYFKAPAIFWDTLHKVALKHGIGNRKVWRKGDLAHLELCLKG